jgi:hypothetical protein
MPSVRWPIAVVAMVVAACGDETQSDGGNKTDRSTVRHAAVPQALAGDWTTTYSKKEAREAGPAFLPGKFTTRFKPDGTWELYAPGTDPGKSCILQENCFTSEASADAHRITVGEFEACVDPGTYAYRIKGDKLTLEKIKEDCKHERPALFVDRTWKRE